MLPHEQERVLQDLNPGIRKLVQWLWDQGFDTCDSGDGETGQFECDRPYPYVVIRVGPSRMAGEAKRLAELLSNRGLDPQPANMEDPLGYPVIEANYNPARKDLPAVIDLMGIADRHCSWLK